MRRWKRVAWAGWLAPALGGCHTTGPATTPDLPAGGLVAHTQAALDTRIRADAREAWRAVRAEYPRRAFTPEFRDGFLDGYADHLDRGGDGTPPPAPPLRYTRHPRYFSPEGHALLKDYFLGFKYGADVAIATGRRQFLTVPVLVPDGGATPIDVLIPAAPAAPAAPVPPSDRPPAAPQPLPPPTPAAQPAAPNLVGYHPPAWDGKTPTPHGAGSPERAATRPAARTAAPPAVGPGGSKFDFGVNAAAVVPTLPAVPAARLPEPPAAVPTLPAHVPTPPVADDLPTLPPTLDLPPPLPANHPEPTR